MEKGKNGWTKIQKIKELKFKVERGDEKAIQQTALLRNQMDCVGKCFFRLLSLPLYLTNQPINQSTNKE